MQVDNYGHGLNNIRQRKRAQSEKKESKMSLATNIVKTLYHTPPTSPKPRKRIEENERIYISARCIIPICHFFTVIIYQGNTILIIIC